METTKQKLTAQLDIASGAINKAQELSDELDGFKSMLKGFLGRISGAVNIQLGEDPTPEVAEAIVAKIDADKKEAVDKTAETVVEEVKKTVAAKAAETKEETGSDESKAAVKKAEDKIVADIDNAKDVAKSKVKEDIKV